MGLPLEEGEGDTPNLEAVSVEHTTAAEPDTESVEEENKVS